MVLNKPAGIRAQVPALATAAPHKPPIRACEEDEGMPYHHVIRFHAMAPTRAPNTT